MPVTAATRIAPRPTGYGASWAANRSAPTDPVADRLKAARSRNSALIGVDAEAHATYDDCGTSKWGGTARTARPRTPGGTPDAK
jgi:hypothetical protein